MRLYLLRHGIAEDGEPGGRDADRALTPVGRKKLREVLRTAARADVKPDLIVSSPFLRAMQTAEIAADVLQPSEPVLQTTALVPSGEPEAIWEEVRVHRDSGQMVLVGHEPLLSRTVAHLLHAPSLMVDFQKGALARIDLEDFGVQPRGVLRWLLTAKLAGA